MITATKRNDKIVLATDKAGTTVFVKLSASGIGSMVALNDGLPLTFFGGSDPYLCVETVLTWYERELGLDPDSDRFKTGVAAFTRVLAKFRAGEINFH